ncbi:MAG: cation:proton antiporter [Dehalococcoidia bacterium]|nr:cation:proton antiporter [Dehalococcoidia bacterium]
MWLPVAIFLGACALIIVIRLAMGPTTPDRLVALDTLNTIIVVSMVILGMAFKEVIYVDVAIVYALLSFITTLFIAKYIEKGKF